MALRTILLPVILSASLAGCYISDSPLIAQDKAVFPYEKISYREEASDDQLTIVHQGSAYVMTGASADAGVEIRFLPIDKDLYLVEAKGENAGKASYLHAVLAVDLANKVARSYAAVGDSDKDPPAGLHKCGDDLCIDRVDAYVAQARAAIAAGEEPDATYTIVEMK